MSLCKLLDKIFANSLEKIFQDLSTRLKINLQLHFLKQKQLKSISFRCPCLKKTKKLKNKRQAEIVFSPQLSLFWIGNIFSFFVVLQIEIDSLCTHSQESLKQRLPQSQLSRSFLLFPLSLLSALILLVIQLYLFVFTYITFILCDFIYQIFLYSAILFIFFSFIRFQFPVYLRFSSFSFQTIYFLFYFSVPLINLFKYSFLFLFSLSLIHLLSFSLTSNVTIFSSFNNRSLMFTVYFVAV